MRSIDDRTVRWNAYWNRKSRTYDRGMSFFDRYLFSDSRQWACSRATGTVLEVAVGTGLNFGLYADEVTLIGVDLSEAMLDIARKRAADLGRPVSLHRADAHHLPFEAETFDTVLCTLGLCAIPRHTLAIAEMSRVLRPGGKLILVDHIGSSWYAVRVAQRALEVFTVPLAGEHFLRRPLNDVLEVADLEFGDAQRFKLGLVERLVAQKAGTGRGIIGNGG
ncbi:class I SAM-dependent methyltransferase [Mycolicibacterium fortuitum]